jgi:hypothetical protein
MSDVISVLSASGEVYEGRCQLVGAITTCTATSGGQATLDDSSDGSGTKLFSVRATAYAPAIILLPEHLYPTFSKAMYLTLGANMTATLYTRQL